MHAALCAQRIMLRLAAELRRRPGPCKLPQGNHLAIKITAAFAFVSVTAGMMHAAHYGASAIRNTRMLNNNNTRMLSAANVHSHTQL
jgi:hypothetical protein